MQRNDVRYRIKTEIMFMSMAFFWNFIIFVLVWWAEEPSNCYFKSLPGIMTWHFCALICFHIQSTLNAIILIIIVYLNRFTLDFIFCSRFQNKTSKQKQHKTNTTTSVRWKHDRFGRNCLHIKLIMICE